MGKYQRSGLKTFLKVFLIVLSSIIMLFLLFITTLNIYKHFLYREYYNSLEKVSKNPGLRKGFIPQGITYKDGTYYTAGYMKDGGTSRIYWINEEDKEEKYVALISNKSPFKGHTGGLQYTSGNFYLADESGGIYIIPEEELLNSESGNFIDIGFPIHVNNNTSFIFSDDSYLYIGEFNNDDKYKTLHPVTYNGVKHKAIVTKYNIDDLSTPLEIYSIPNEIQGFCITPDGRVVLSRSYGVGSSDFFIYEKDDIVKTDVIINKAPVYFFTEPSKTIKAPCMSEDLDIANGKVITLFESASNKYIFGKFFFANYIAMLDF